MSQAVGLDVVIFLVEERTWPELHPANPHLLGEIWGTRLKPDPFNILLARSVGGTRGSERGCSPLMRDEAAHEWATRRRWPAFRAIADADKPGLWPFPDV